MAATTIYKRLRGDWMRDGYIDDLSGRALEIIIVNGMSYDAELYDAPCGRPSWPDDCRLTLCTDGELRAWGKSTSFAPDSGEIDRIGRSFFSCKNPA